MNLEMLEIVLRELLEEQKNARISNEDMVAKIQYVLEKLDRMEHQIQPKDEPSILERLRVIQIACNNQSTKRTIQPTEIIPCHTIVKHHYYFKTTAVIATSFFLFIVTLIWLYIGKIKEVNTYKANNTKYRYLKLNANPDLSTILRLTDSLYHFASDSILRKVEWIEKQELENLKIIEQSSKKKQPAKHSPK